MANGIYDLFAKNKELSYLIPCSSDSQVSKFDEYFDQNEIEYNHAIVFKTVPAEVKNDVDINKYDMLVFFSPVTLKT